MPPDVAARLRHAIRRHYAHVTIPPMSRCLIVTETIRYRQPYEGRQEEPSFDAATRHTATPMPPARYAARS